MSRSPRPTFYAALFTAIASLSGLILVLFRRWRSAPVEPPQPTPETPEDVPAAGQADVEKPEAAAAPSVLRITAALAGTGCLALAQMLLLGSREPLMPLILFILGGLLLQPIYIYYERCWRQDTPAAAQISAMPEGGLMSVFTLARRAMREHREAIIGVLVLTLAAVLIQRFTPASPFLTLPGSLFAVLLVPAVYLCGRQFGGVAAGIYAAGLAAVSGWALVLGQAGNLYAALAVISALMLLALEYARHRLYWTAYLWPGICAGVGTLILPNFIYSLLLLPLVAGLDWLDQRSGAHARLNAVVVAVLAGLVISLPVLVFGQSQILFLSARTAEALANPQLSWGEALPTTLLLLNLTSDPNPLHGIVHRPVLSPLEAALFLAGLVGIAWRIHSTRRWSEGWLPLALVILALPSAALLEMPVRYPDLQRAAGMLPAALVIAALGMAWLAQSMRWRGGKTGTLLFILILVIVFCLIFVDWQGHYRQVFLPLVRESTIFISAR